MEYSTILIIEIVFVENTLTKTREVKIYPQPILSSDNLIPLTKETKKKEISVGETLEKFWLFPSVSGTDTTLTKEKKYKRELSGGTP